jgi:hypothetical protein
MPQPLQFAGRAGALAKRPGSIYKEHVVPEPVSKATAVLVVVAAAAVLAGCAKTIDDPVSGEVDFTSPKSVLGSVFHAARTGETDHLAGLCDPAGEASAPARRICAVTADSKDFASFRANFARARLDGEPRIAGDQASIKFLYGPRGSDPEVMKLVRREGRWYLLSF